MITVGIDEVGRGCWAGPLVAGAVVLPPANAYSLQQVTLRDSKQLTKRQREVSTDWIYRQAPAVGLGWVWPAEIDAMGLTASVKLAMERALAEINCAYEQIIIDGSYNFLPANPKAMAVTNADSSVPAVSAASIVAKVARDTYMVELGEQYAGYGFAAHVGYGTPEHRTALKLLGVSDIHRRSFKPIQALLL